MYWQAECTGKGETVPTLRSGPLHSILYVCVDGEVRVRGANWIRQTGFRQTGFRQTGFRQTGPIPSSLPKKNSANWITKFGKLDSANWYSANWSYNIKLGHC